MRFGYISLAIAGLAAAQPLTAQPYDSEIAFNLLKRQLNSTIAVTPIAAAGTTAVAAGTAAGASSGSLSGVIDRLHKAADGLSKIQTIYNNLQAAYNSLPSVSDITTAINQVLPYEDLVALKDTLVSFLPSLPTLDDITNLASKLLPHLPLAKDILLDILKDEGGKLPFSGPIAGLIKASG